MRARWLKPEFFKDRKIGALGAIAALVYEALWCMADDVGTAPCDPDRIKGEMFFAWAEVGLPNISEALLALSRAGRIRRYRVGDDVYCRIVQFGKHQAVHNPSKFRYPQESEADSVVDSGEGSSTTEDSGSTPESFGSPHILDSKIPRHLDTSKASAADAAPPEKPPRKRSSRESKPQYPHFEKADCDRLYLAWQHLGTPDYGRFRRALAPLFPEQPRYSVEQVVAAIEEAIDDATREKEAGKPYAFNSLTPESFVQRVDHWVREAEAPLEIDGIPTEKFRRIMGAA